MKIRNTAQAATLMVLLGAMAQAQALPTLFDVTGLAGTETYTDNGAQSATLTDVDGARDDLTAFLLFESAGFAPTTSFGIYDYSRNEIGDIVLGDMLEVFAGAESAITSREVMFNLTTGEASSAGVVRNIDATFGFYINVGQTNQTYYSHTALNDDGFDHAMMYDTFGSGIGGLFGSSIVLAWEDLYGGGDQDYNDLVIGVNDVRANVPEPGSLALLGIGLLSLGALRRRTS